MEALLKKYEGIIESAYTDLKVKDEYLHERDRTVNTYFKETIINEIWKANHKIKVVLDVEFGKALSKCIKRT